MFATALSPLFLITASTLSVHALKPPQGIDVLAWYNGRQGTCAKTDLPTEEQYTAGYNSFCDSYFMNDTVNHLGQFNDGTDWTVIGTPVTQWKGDVVGTALISDYHGRPIQWTYRLGHRGWGTHIRYLTHRACQAAFMGLIQGYESKFLVTSPTQNDWLWNGGGILGIDYCVVEGTGGLNLTGQGDVLVQGSKASFPLEIDGKGNQYAWFYVEARQK